MNRLHELIKDKLHRWPEGIELICVSKRNGWMFYCKQGAAHSDHSAAFSALGPCSSLYRGLKCTEEQYEEITKGAYP